MVSLWFLPSLGFPPKEYLDMKWIISLPSIHSLLLLSCAVSLLMKKMLLSFHWTIHRSACGCRIHVGQPSPYRLGCRRPTVPELARCRQSPGPGVAVGTHCRLWAAPHKQANRSKFSWDVGSHVILVPQSSHLYNGNNKLPHMVSVWETLVKTPIGIVHIIQEKNHWRLTKK